MNWRPLIALSLLMLSSCCSHPAGAVAPLKSPIIGIWESDSSQSWLWAISADGNWYTRSVDGPGGGYDAEYGRWTSLDNVVLFARPAGAIPFVGRLISIGDESIVVRDNHGQEVKLTRLNAATLGERRKLLPADFGGDRPSVDALIREAENSKQ